MHVIKRKCIKRIYKLFHNIDDFYTFCGLILQRKSNCGRNFYNQIQFTSYINMQLYNSYPDTISYMILLYTHQKCKQIFICELHEYRFYIRRKLIASKIKIYGKI